MKTTFTFRSLTPRDLNQMFRAFKMAFSDYPDQFIANKEQFVRKFVQKFKINFTLSGGAFAGEEMVGFIFNSINYYHNKMTAYNGATGVIPSYRGAKISARIYGKLLEAFAQHEIEQCVLEVLTTNTKAIRLYEALGFQKTKRYLCYRLDSQLLATPNLSAPISFNIVSEPDWYTYEKFQEFKPAFLDSRLMVNRNLSNETIVEAYLGGECVGYAIYQTALGRVGQLAVSTDYRKLGIGYALMHYIYDTSMVKAISIMNVDMEDKASINFLEKMHFKMHIDQYEMILSLK